VFEALLEATRDDTDHVATEALYTLGVLAPGGSPSANWRTAAVDQFTGALAHPDRGHRLAALRVIARVFAPAPGAAVSDPIAAAVLLLLNDRQQEVRIAAIEALGALRDTRAVQALMERFGDARRSREGEAALAALSAVGHPSASPIFIEHLADGSSERRRLAIEGLARTGPAAVLADIQTRLARDTNRELALAASFAAARLADGPVDVIVGALLQQGLRDQAFAYLTELVGRRHQALSPYVHDPDASLRGMLADAAALSMDVQALPLVEALTRDPDPTVAVLAARAVSWLQRRR
jgi:HEAT repeat protein